ncbi:BREX-1 system adenine-specific DNA-methyltransferase PglX [Adlercreutzia equolifaciens]|uniref:BREX-1 system adenine-specific DNA-methyltransferase PglX n=1 Tax=Adlercreutzia equolifaciens TaxID=446660 RepID=UPI00266F9521|nr:BREX-1 system adenine-specific DNA-methyltransferase PglX [Adlercreutzia equolifaciens]
MQDTAIKNFCIWARRELMAQVALQARRFGIREDGYDPATADAIEGRPLTADERRQRADLIRRLGPVDAPGYKEAYENLVDQAAYTWFNRLIAIRFMELNDRLPSHVRMLSAADGAFRPQVLREALDVPIEGLDAAQVSELLRASDDEALFRCLFLAQCRELAACLPDVFEPVGAAMELLLPEGLLRQGSVVQRLVDDVPEEDWREGVEIVGWMYQYYVSERKDEVFASFKKGKKADAGAIAPATQLFTPDWIVRYLTENSLGRLWLQSHSESHLADQMPYYIPDNLGAEDADADSGTRPVGGDLGRPSEPAISPESLRVIDPACGSGHILVYAFRLLAAMYEEAGHIRRDIPRLILQNNLTGCEIDPRAAQMASFALAMTACEWDSRFLRRADKVSANIVCLRPAEIDAEELEEMPYLAERAELLGAMAHMGECGSLFAPEPEDIAALERADDELDAREAGGDLLAHRPHAAVAQMLANCKPLIETYDAVIANPPYMGSSNMDKWLANWAKKHYPDSKRDLCTCFIERGFTLAKPCGYSAMVTMQSWMFLGSFEALREKTLKERSIASMAHLGTRAFDAIGGEVVATTATVFGGSPADAPASYLRLVDFDGEAAKEEAIREAIANPTCGWFYRRSTGAFKSIPGTPIAYWASEKQRAAFESLSALSTYAYGCNGMTTGENAKFLRIWHEVSISRIGFETQDVSETRGKAFRWFPYNKGGEFRKWYGNRDYVINWEDNGRDIRDNGHLVPRSMNYMFRRGVSWSKISSGKIAFRVEDPGRMFDVAGLCLFPLKEEINLAALAAFGNATVASSFLEFLSPTLNFEVGDVSSIPISEEVYSKTIEMLAKACVDISSADWCSREISCGFLRHPMV